MNKKEGEMEGEMEITIDKAIQNLEEITAQGIFFKGGERDEAIRLGVEALKRIKAKRLHFEVDIDRLLTGEKEKEA